MRISIAMRMNGEKVRDNNFTNENEAIKGAMKKIDLLAMFEMLWLGGSSRLSIYSSRPWEMS